MSKFYFYQIACVAYSPNQQGKAVPIYFDVYGTIEANSDYAICSSSDSIDLEVYGSLKEFKKEFGGKDYLKLTRLK